MLSCQLFRIIKLTKISVFVPVELFNYLGVCCLDWTCFCTGNTGCISHGQRKKEQEENTNQIKLKGPLTFPEFLQFDRYVVLGLVYISPSSLANRKGDQSYWPLVTHGLHSVSLEQISKKSQQTVVRPWGKLYTNCLKQTVDSWMHINYASPIRKLLRLSHNMLKGHT